MKPNPNNKNELLYRFGGVTKEGELFYVQIKENLKSELLCAKSAEYP